MICVQCLKQKEEARLDGAPVCIVCADLLIADPGARRNFRQCSRCHGPVRGGYQDVTPICVACATAELERAMALEMNPSMADLLPPLHERPARPLPPPVPTRSQVVNDLARIRERFRRDGVICPPERDWLDD